MVPWRSSGDFPPLADGLLVVVAEPAVGLFDPLSELGSVLPAEINQSGDVEELAGRPFGVCGVEAELDLRSYRIADDVSEVFDAQVDTGADDKDVGTLGCAVDSAGPSH